MAYVGAGHSSGAEHDQQGERDRDQTPPGRPPAGQGEDRAEPVDPRPAPTCRAYQQGWAGAHRHLGVRPRQRANRRERPPHRWC
ncbi:hypothetical protein [Micromonospora sp. NBC_01813]|uniref:hypothetical protein n=1 Tax=Micromonospora sp. NBC_01813 TaxID=2975988 RepID=UPI002DD7C732|nr:hypothetical protein [Micromonospora sp. NBC_01813]WSA09438.1 hypothetical protein OG958_00975 [Micromonospora sp. NBC_01813]